MMMTKFKIIAILSFGVLTTSCTTKQWVGGTVATVATVGVYKFIKDKRDKNNLSETDPIRNVPLSGTMDGLGGMLVNERQVLHVTHWPIKNSQIVRFSRNSGGFDTRSVISKKNLGNDLSLLTLDRPLDLVEHTIIPLEEAVVDDAVTVFRFKDRDPIGTTIEGFDGGWINIRLTPDRFLETGDSGKIWVQEREGDIVFVGMNTKSSGRGPNIHKIYTNYIWNILEEK